MGGGQSLEETGQLDDVRLSGHRIQESNTDARSDAETAPNPDEPATELPQCRMGAKSVDDMCFMISCTNWY